MAPRARPDAGLCPPRLHLRRGLRGGHGKRSRRAASRQAVRHDGGRGWAGDGDGGGGRHLVAAKALLSLSAVCPSASLTIFTSSIPPRKLVHPFHRGVRREGTLAVMAVPGA